MSESFFSKDYWVAATISYHRMQMQAVTGIGFDSGQASSLAERIEGMMKEIESEIEPKLPERPLNKGETDYWRIPAKPFNKDGELSSTMLKWMEKTGAKIYQFGDGFSSRLQALLDDHKYIELDGETYPIIGGTETKTKGKMTLANQDDLKDWLIRDCGWKPTLWNVKKDARGKPMRDDKGNVIQTSPKMQENGKLCPNLEALQGDLVRPVVKWLSLRNRKSVIEGWLDQPRLAFDGRQSASATGFTNTFRYKHSNVVNCPKADPKVVLGKEMRSLFVCNRPGYKFVGYDATALEARVEAHYCLQYEGGKEHSEKILTGDVHSLNAFLFYRDELLGLGFTHAYDGIKDDERFKPYRNRAKNGAYSMAYGASVKKFAATIGKPVDEAEEAYENYWNGNPALKQLKERLTMAWEQSGKRWVRGIDGRKVFTRSKHSLVNSLFQSCGAIVMELSTIFMDKWLGGLVLDKDNYPCYSYKGYTVYRTGFFHDELCFEAPEEIAEEIAQLGVKSIEAAGRHLKTRVPLTGEGKVNTDWAGVH